MPTILPENVSQGVPRCLLYLLHSLKKHVCQLALLINMPIMLQDLALRILNAQMAHMLIIQR